MKPLVWTLTALSGFAFLLAIQMRFLVSHALRKALAAKLGGDANDPAYRAAIAAIGRAPAASDAARHLDGTYPRPLSHLYLARRISLIMPVILIALAAALRAVYGAN
jgi:hypothetical protein